MLQNLAEEDLLNNNLSDFAYDTLEAAIPCHAITPAELKDENKDTDDPYVKQFGFESLDELTDDLADYYDDLFLSSQGIDQKLIDNGVINLDYAHILRTDLLNDNARIVKNADDEYALYFIE